MSDSSLALKEYGDDLEKIRDDFGSFSGTRGGTKGPGTRPRLDLRPDEERAKPCAPEYWSPLHNIICSLKAVGTPNVKIAEMLDITPGYVSVITNDPRGIAAIKEFHGQALEKTTDVPKRLQELSIEAVEVVAEQLDSNDENVAQRAAFGILDRAGYGKIEKKFVASAHISEEAAALIRGAMDESETIEADYSLVEED